MDQHGVPVVQVYHTVIQYFTYYILSLYILYCTVMYSPQVAAHALNALQQEVRAAVEDHITQAQKQGQIPFKRIPAPADGLCMYHCIMGTATLSSWTQVSRNSGGIAVNRRQERAESNAANTLRELALQSTPETDPVIMEQALCAQQALSVDVSELSWLGQSLGISIRCTIEDKVWCYQNRLLI